MNDLLITRYKIIADYPKRGYKIGHIFIIDGKNSFSAEWFDKYPHLFKKLEWWQERKPEEMPQFVKENIELTGKKEAKVREPKYYSGEFFEDRHDKKFRQYSLTVYLPATKKEWISPKR